MPSQKENKYLTLVLDVLANETEGFLQTMEDNRLSIAESGAIYSDTPFIKIPEAKAFLSSEPFASIAHDLIGPDVRLYWDQIVYKQTQNQGVSLGIKIMGMVSLNPSST